MKFELPKFERCCLCIPLRYGLIIWAYVKMIPSLFSLVIYAFNFGSLRNGLESIVVILPIAALSIDIAFNILLLVACHKKHVKSFLVYYYYSIVMMVIFGILTSLNFFYMIYLFAKSISDIGGFFIAIMLVGLLSINILNLMLQFYLIMLVKSEVMKLTTNATFTFVNIKTPDIGIETCAKMKEEKVRYDRFDNQI